MVIPVIVTPDTVIPVMGIPAMTTDQTGKEGLSEKHGQAVKIDKTPAAFRHELKHMVTPAEDAVLVSRLSRLFRRDSHAGNNGVYRVNSLYFDTPDDKALAQKAAGVSDREKFRLRYYDRDLTFLRLEKKIMGLGTITNNISGNIVASFLKMANGVDPFIKRVGEAEAAMQRLGSIGFSSDSTASTASIDKTTSAIVDMANVLNRIDFSTNIENAHKRLQTLIGHSLHKSNNWHFEVTKEQELW